MAVRISQAPAPPETRARSSRSLGFGAIVRKVLKNRAFPIGFAPQAKVTKAKSEITFVASEITFVAGEITFAASEITFVVSEVTFAAS